MRDFVSLARDMRGWSLDRVEGGHLVYRYVLDLGPAEFELERGGGVALIYVRRGVKEWNGVVERRWVEASRIGFRMGPDAPVEWI